MKRNAIFGIFALGMTAALMLSTASQGGGAVSGSGLVVLHPSAQDALSMTGNSTVQVPSAAVYVNSNAERAISTVGTAILDTPNLYVVGNASFGGQSRCTGAVHRGSVAYANPYSGFQVPSSAGVIDRGGVSVRSNSTVTLQPGRYTREIRITGNGNVTMMPGVYFIEHGMSITAGTLMGEGVTIMMMEGSLSIGGVSEMRLSPPQDGPTAGVVLSAHPNNCGEMSLAGGSGVLVTGGIYLPTQLLTLTGNSSLAGTGPQMGDLIVANRVRLTGTSLIRIGAVSAPPISLPSQPLFD